MNFVKRLALLICIAITISACSVDLISSEESLLSGKLATPLGNNSNALLSGPEVLNITKKAKGVYEVTQDGKDGSGIFRASHLFEKYYIVELREDTDEPFIYFLVRFEDNQVLLPKFDIEVAAKASNVSIEKKSSYWHLPGGERDLRALYTHRILNLGNDWVEDDFGIFNMGVRSERRLFKEEFAKAVKIAKAKDAEKAEKEAQATKLGEKQNEALTLVVPPLLLRSSMISSKRLISRPHHAYLPREFYLHSNHVPLLPKSTQDFYHMVRRNDGVYQAKNVNLEMAFDEAIEPVDGYRSMKRHKYIVEFAFIDGDGQQQYRYVETSQTRSRTTKTFDSANFYNLKPITESTLAVLHSEAGVKKNQIVNGQIIVDDIRMARKIYDAAPYPSKYNITTYMVDFDTKYGVEFFLEKYEIVNNRSVGRKPEKTRPKPNYVSHCISHDWDEKFGMMRIRNGCNHPVNFEICVQSKTNAFIDLISGHGGGFASENAYYECEYRNARTKGVLVTQFAWAGEKSIGLAKLLTNVGYKITATK